MDKRSFPWVHWCVLSEGKLVGPNLFILSPNMGMIKKSGPLYFFLYDLSVCNVYHSIYPHESNSVCFCNFRMPLTFPGRFYVLADSQGCCLCPLRMWDPLALGQSIAKLLENEVSHGHTARNSESPCVIVDSWCLVFKVDSLSLNTVFYSNSLKFANHPTRLACWLVLKIVPTKDLVTWCFFLGLNNFSRITTVFAEQMSTKTTCFCSENDWTVAVWTRWAFFDS